MTVYLTRDDISAICIALIMREFQLKRLLQDKVDSETEALYTIELATTEQALSKLVNPSDEIAIVVRALRDVYFESLT